MADAVNATSLASEFSDEEWETQGPDRLDGAVGGTLGSGISH